MTVPTNGHGPSAAGEITRSPSFAPVTPVVKERVGDVATRLSEVERIIEDINSQSATSASRSPTIGDLQQEIELLKKDIEDTKVIQKKQIDGLRNSVRSDVKDQIFAKPMRAEIGKKINGSIEAQVKAIVGEWGESEDAKKLVASLKSLVGDNNVLRQEAQVKLDNSRSRHENSTLDEHADFETDLSKISLPDGTVSNKFPRTLKALFSYDDKQLLQLFDDYGLQRLDTHLENLNRFLAFIGLRFSIPQQSLDFLDNPPPAYTSPNILESSKEENTAEVSPPNQAEKPTNQVKKNTEGTSRVQSEPGKPPHQPAASESATVEMELNDKREDEKRMDSEKHRAQQHRIGQNRAGVDPSILTRQQPSGVANPVLQTTFTHPARPVNHSPLTLQQPGNKGVGGWFKTFTEGL